MYISQSKLELGCQKNLNRRIRVNVTYIYRECSNYIRRTVLNRVNGDQCDVHGDRFWKMEYKEFRTHWCFDMGDAETDVTTALDMCVMSCFSLSFFLHFLQFVIKLEGNHKNKCTADI